ncbi:virulence factor BrkB family protein [Vibrio olivae]|uniref:UPF0761 membrane protein ACFFUV_15225 n=1 Tax=Vibrio olivae TaxID=1243002 RepID=A0ABV5HQ07_9VIBR
MNHRLSSYKMKTAAFARLSVRFFRHLFARVMHDRVSVSAGYMAYITLLSLVPMLTVLFSVLSTFELFANSADVIQEFVITHFVPAAGEAVSTALSEFIQNTGKMTAVGSLFLFITALMLISNIDKNLNYIWRARGQRQIMFSFAMYWMVITLGPILVGTSIAVTSYITSLKLIENETLSGLYSGLLPWLPVFLSFCAFMGLYLLVPNKTVRFVHAVIGSATSAILFELIKNGFAFYITQFPSYQLIYGTLAAIPILFVWVYLCWFIVLIGAEVTASLGEHEQWAKPQLVVDSDSEQSQ